MPAATLNPMERKVIKAARSSATFTHECMPASAPLGAPLKQYFRIPTDLGDSAV